MGHGLFFIRCFSWYVGVFGHSWPSILSLWNSRMVMWIKINVTIHQHRGEQLVEFRFWENDPWDKNTVYIFMFHSCQSFSLTSLNENKLSPGEENYTGVCVWNVANSLRLVTQLWSLQHKFSILHARHSLAELHTVHLCYEFFIVCAHTRANIHAVRCLSSACSVLQPCKLACCKFDFCEFWIKVDHVSCNDENCLRPCGSCWKDWSHIICLLQQEISKWIGDKLLPLHSYKDIL